MRSNKKNKMGDRWQRLVYKILFKNLFLRWNHSFIVRTYRHVHYYRFTAIIQDNLH